MLFSFSSLQVFPLFAGFYAAYAYRCSDKQVRISAQVPGRWAAADGVHGGKGRTDFVTSKALGRRKIPPGIDAPAPARVEDCRSRGCSPSSEGEPTGTGGERKAPCKRREKPTLPYANPCRGLDAPTPEKASGTATTGKSPLLPILTAGLAMSRAMELGSFHQLLERARARLFPPSKWAGLFPSAAYRRSAPRSWRWADSTNASWDVTAQVGWLRCIHKQTCFPTHSWRWTYLTSAAWDTSMRLGWFRSAKNRLDFFLLPLALSMLNQRRLG